MTSESGGRALALAAAVCCVAALGTLGNGLAAAGGTGIAPTAAPGQESGVGDENGDGGDPTAAPGASSEHRALPTGPPTVSPVGPEGAAPAASVPAALLVAAAAALALARRTRRRQGSPTDGSERDPVTAAWLSMARELDGPDGPAGTATPREYAGRAKRAGYDPEAVEGLTAAFEAVRYGDEPLTPERRRAARAGHELGGERP
jgi:hypothetical protein